MKKYKLKHVKVTEKESLFLAFVVLFLAFNMRGPITGLGVLNPFIQESLSLSSAKMGLLTSLPLISFAGFSIIVPIISEHTGFSRCILMGLFFLLVGLLVRSFLGSAGLFAGMVFVGIGISVLNVLVPSTIKQNFFVHMGLMTGLYNVSMSLSSAVASAVSVPVCESFGWASSLGIWAIFTVIAILLWLVYMISARYKKSNFDPMKRKLAARETIARSKKKSRFGKLFRSPLAWQVAMCMGLQSFIWYSLSAWLPSIYVSKGLSTEMAGYMGTILQFACLPSSIIAPVWAAKAKNQRAVSAACYGCYFIGLLSILFAPQGALLYVATILMGLGCGTGVPMALSFINLRSSNIMQTAQLSGFSQTLGYTLASVGPTLFGAMFDMTGTWVLPICILAGAAVLMIVLGQFAGRDLKIPE